MKRIFTLLFISFIPTLLWAQKDYNKLHAEIEQWTSSTMSEISSTSSRTVKYPAFGYSIRSHFKKGTIIDGALVDIVCRDSTTRLYGIAHHENERIYIKGIIYERKENEWKPTTYGSFFISNTSSNSITCKAKAAGALAIQNRDINYIIGHHNEYPVILSIKESCIALDGKTSNRSFIGFYASLDSSKVQKIGQNNISEIIASATTNCRIERSDHELLYKEIKPLIGQCTSIAITPGINTPIGTIGQVIKRNSPALHLILIKDTNTSIIEEEWIVPEESIPSDSILNAKVYFKNAKTVCYKLRNGDSYKGPCRVTLTNLSNDQGYSVTTNITIGEYIYQNGDKFAGDLFGDQFAGLPINGVTKFSDSTYAYGNWLLKYKLTQEQADSLQKIRFPIDVREQAEKFNFSNCYTLYKLKDHLCGWNLSYFNPKEEHCEDARYYSGHCLLHNKSTGWYSVLKDKESKKILVDLLVDNHGRHIQEITYDYNGNPQFINKLTWYSNGEIQSIKSYHYKTQLLYLDISYYSDGTLKNAYMYSIGNNGRNIMRQSKEVDPTYGTYRAVLYDLDGNYERHIKWEIGDYGGPRPSHLDLEDYNKLP